MARTRSLIRNAEGDGGSAPDTLPWLEPADDAYDETPGFNRLWLALGALVFIAALAGTAWFFYNQSSSARQEYTASGLPPLIAAPKGPYKLRPVGVPEDKKDVMDQVAQGEPATQAPQLAGKPPADEPLLDPATVFGNEQSAPARPGPAPVAPPPPVLAPKAEPPPPPAAKGPSLPPAPTPREILHTAPRPATSPAAPPAAMPAPPVQQAAPAASGGFLVQLGAFSSTDRAGKAWADFSSRFRELNALSKDIAPIKVGGKTVYRLRGLGVPSQQRGAQICDKLKASGQACLVQAR